MLEYRSRVTMNNGVMFNEVSFLNDTDDILTNLEDIHRYLVETKNEYIFLIDKKLDNVIIRKDSIISIDNKENKK